PHYAPARNRLAPGSLLSVRALQLRRASRARVLVELDLANAHVLGGHLDALVLTGEFKALLESELTRGGHPLERVGRRGAHVRELLLLGDVDVHVFGA